MLIIIIILVLLVIALLLYNMKIYKQMKSFSNTNQKINSLSVLQDFMNIVGSDKPVTTKITEINEKLIEKYNIKYSTIVTFNGAEYILQATNVEERHWGVMKNLHKEDVFRESITKAIPKYITVNNETERLAYQTTEVGRAKSAIFFPLYIDNIYIGYWIIESGEIHAFDNIDLSIIDVVKENIIVVLKTVQYQNTMENIVRKDLFTGLNSAEYLYGQAKSQIDRFPTSVVCMLKITNLEDVNNQYSRKLGNNVVIEVSNVIKSNISSQYIFVRYMGPKFVIVFVGEGEEEVTRFLGRVSEEIERTEVYEDEGNKEKQEARKQKGSSKKVIPKVNFVISTYYKGTGIESVTKKLEEYLDNAPKEENDINII